MSKGQGRWRNIKRILWSNWLSLLLALLAAVAVSLVIFALVNTPQLAENAPQNMLVYDLAVGFILSYIFYVLVVSIPERSKRARMRRSLKRSFADFKLRCIYIYLSAIGDSWDSDLPQSLLDPINFMNYFAERFSTTQNRWHAVHNGLYEHGLPQLITECEIFAREIQFTLIKLDIDDDEVTLLLSQLSVSLLRLKTSSPSYDDIKSLLNFLYPIHSHWSVLDGISGIDPVGDMISRI